MARGVGLLEIAAMVSPTQQLEDRARDRFVDNAVRVMLRHHARELGWSYRQMVRAASEELRLMPHAYTEKLHRQVVNVMRGRDAYE